MTREPGRAVEVGASILLFLVITLRTFGYAPLPDRSHDLGEDDGYPYYAKHLDEAGTLLPDYRRLPGYPLFLVASSRIMGSYYSKAAQEVQGFLSLAVVMAVWWPIRQRFGRLVALILLALLAAPNLWIRLAAFPFLDFLAALLWCAFVLLTFCWIIGGGWKTQTTYATAVFAIIAMMILLKAGISILLVIFAVAFVAAHLMVSRTWRGSGRIASRALAVVLGSIAAQSAIVSVCGTGSLTFYGNAMHARIATYLPPAADNEAERIVERAKEEIGTREGQSVEDENFTNTLAVVQPAIEAVWRDRLRAHPVRYLGVMLDEVRRKHYFVAASFTPFMADTTPNLARIPRRDGSMASAVYRRTGLYLPGVGEGVPATMRALADGVLRLALFWAPLLYGIALLFRRWPYSTLTMLLSLAGHLAALTFGIFVDGRYLLPFAPFIYLAQAVGLASFVQLLAKSDITGARDRAPAALRHGGQPMLTASESS